MDRSRVFKKVLLDLVTAPVTLLPVAAGSSLLMVGWALGSGAGLLALLGVSGILAGLGALATRWILRSDQIARHAVEAIQAEAMQAQAQTLDALDRKLRQDKDPRTETVLRELRSLYDSFKKDAGWVGEINARVAYEIANTVEKLFRGCIISLERSLDLWHSARKMRTEERKSAVLASRERILEELAASVHQLAKTLDDVQALTLDRAEDESLARIREELNESLAVAHRVEARMQSLEAELDPTVPDEYDRD